MVYLWWVVWKKLSCSSKYQKESYPGSELIYKRGCFCTGIISNSFYNKALYTWGVIFPPGVIRSVLVFLSVFSSLQVFFYLRGVFFNWTRMGSLYIMWCLEERVAFCALVNSHVLHYKDDYGLGVSSLYWVSSFIFCSISWWVNIDCTLLSVLV